MINYLRGLRQYFYHMCFVIIITSYLYICIVGYIQWEMLETDHSLMLEHIKQNDFNSSSFFELEKKYIIDMLIELKGYKNCEKDGILKYKCLKSFYIFSMSNTLKLPYPILQETETKRILKLKKLKS